MLGQLMPFSFIVAMQKIVHDNADAKAVCELLPV
jgi:hypothetical protein